MDQQDVRHQKDRMGSPFVCDMDALTAEERTRHRELALQLRPAVKEFIELPDGYAVRFLPDRRLALEIAEFVTLESLCCPFFTIAMEIEKEGGPIFLKITGREGVKPFIRSEFGISEKQLDA